LLFIVNIFNDFNLFFFFTENSLHDNKKCWIMYCQMVYSDKEVDLKKNSVK
jgi:hypothetical protein